MLLLMVTPVSALPEPTPTPETVEVVPNSGFTVNIPEGSPWWAGIAIAAIGTGGWLLRGYSKRLDAKQAAALKSVENDFALKLETIRAEQTEKSNAAGQIDALASSISQMASSTRGAYEFLEHERKSREVSDQALGTEMETVRALRQQQVEVMGEMVNVLQAAQTQHDEAIVPGIGKIATRDEAHTRTNVAVVTINEHTDEALKPVVAELKALTERMDDFDGGMKDVKAKLDEAITLLQKKLDTGGGRVMADVTEPPSGNEFPTSGGKATA